MGLQSILLPGILALVTDVVLATRSARKSEDWSEVRSEDERHGRPPCPKHSSLKETDDKVNRREYNYRRLWTEGGDAGGECVCEAGYEPVRRDSTGAVVQRLTRLTLAPTQPGRLSHWDGECREMTCYASQKTPYKYLLFEGGGVRGIAYAGAVRALEEAGLMEHVEGFSGASAGSQVAALLAAGYRGEELIEVLVKMDFHSLMDEDRGWALNVLSNKFGYYKGEAIEEVIDSLIKAKTGRSCTTFAELQAYSCTKLKSCKEFKVPALCVNTGRLVWFSAETTPDVSVARAVRASSSIPFFYQPPEIIFPDGSSCLFVDGGTLRNLPHDAFTLTPDRPALGLSLRDHGRQGVTQKEKFDGITSYITQLYEAMIFGPDSANSIEVFNKPIDIIDVCVQDVSVTDFDLYPIMKGSLLESGYEALRSQIMTCQLSSAPLASLPEWLSSAQTSLLRDDFAKRVSEGISNTIFAPWWSAPSTRDAFSKHVIYTGDVEKVGRGTRFVEVLEILGHTYIVTHMPLGAGPQSHSLIHDIYVLHGTAVVNVSPTLENEQLRKCLKLKVYNLKETAFDFERKEWQFEGLPDSINVCGDNAFLNSVCKVHLCVDDGHEYYPYPAYATRGAKTDAESTGTK